MSERLSIKFMLPITLALIIFILSTSFSGLIFYEQTRAEHTIELLKTHEKILDKIKKKFGRGGIYTIERSKKFKNQQDHRQYYVQKFNDLYKIAEFFKKQHFYTTKKKDFELWSQILEIIKKDEHKTEPGFLEICKLRDEMNKMSGKTHKRNTEIIKLILENRPEYIAAHR